MKYFISRIAKISVTVFLMLLTCELATVCFSRVKRSISERDTVIGRRYYPMMDELIYDHEQGEPVRFRTNQFGFRGDVIAKIKPPGVKRVAILGDSYTASQALPEEETFCHQLQCLLNRSIGTESWEVYNFGIPGSGTGQELALYRGVVRQLDIDAVIIAFGNATDVRDNSVELSSNPIIQFVLNDSGELEQVAMSARRVGVSQTLNRYSKFYAWQKRKLGSLSRHLFKETNRSTTREHIYAENESPAFTRAWDLTHTILNVFRDECRESGVELFVAALPSAYQVYPDHFAEICEQSDTNDQMDPMHPDTRIAKICEDLELPFVSLTPAFQAATPSHSYQCEEEHLFFGGVGHFNSNGSELVAKQIHNLLEQDYVAKLRDKASKRF